MLKIHRFSAILSVFLIGYLALSFSAKAQVYREEFGRNRIQYKYFDWQYIESNNFQVYYYNGGADLAQKSVTFLEAEFSRITELLGYFPYSKTRVFLYNSIADKQQSNVGVHGEDFTIGGQTIFIKSQVEVAFSGDYASYTSKLVYEVANMLVEEMLFGGNIAEMFQSALANPIPVWFTKGIASYVAYGWSKDMDDLAREYLSSDDATKLSKVGEESSALLGQSIWNFTAQTYGQRSVSNILNLARIVRDEESSIAKTLGIPYKQFMDQWKAYYINMNNNILEGYKEVPDAKIVSSKPSKTQSISSVRFNPQGTLLAYAVAEQGKYEVRVVNMESKDELTIHKGGQRLIDQETNQSYPLLSWVDEFTLGIVSYEEGRNIVRIKRVGAKGEQILNIPSLAQIQSFEFKEGGRLAAMTGVVDGRSDAFLFLINRGSVRRISNDYYDDKDIRFLPESNVVVFASNRSSDSLYVTGPDALEKVNTNQFNLFTYDVDLVDSTFGKLTNSLSVESSPVPISSNQLYYLSDQQGISNLYKHIISDSLSIQLSNYNVGMKDFSVDTNNNRIAFVSLSNGQDAVFVESLSAFQSIFTPGTPRRQQENIKILAEIRKRRLLEAGESDSLPKATTLPEGANSPQLDSLKSGAIDTENYVFRNESKVDSKNYKFETNDTEGESKILFEYL